MAAGSLSRETRLFVLNMLSTGASACCKQEQSTAGNIASAQLKRMERLHSLQQGQRCTSSSAVSQTAVWILKLRHCKQAIVRHCLDS